MGDTDLLKPIFDPGHLLKGEGGAMFLDSVYFDMKSNWVGYDIFKGTTIYSSWPGSDIGLEKS